MKLKTRPTKPRRRTDIQETFHVENGTPLQRIVEWAEGFKVLLDDVKFDNEDCCGGEYSSPSHKFSLERTETDDEFNARLKTYEKEFTKWQTWYDTNKDEIERTQTEIEQKDKEQKAKLREREMKRLQKQRDDAEKQLKKLAKEHVESVRQP